jgi:hypothetical protein
MRFEYIASMTIRLIVTVFPLGTIIIVRFELNLRRESAGRGASFDDGAVWDQS